MEKLKIKGFAVQMRTTYKEQNVANIRKIRIEWKGNKIIGVLI